DGIRDFHVTGVQTCALPISKEHPRLMTPLPTAADVAAAAARVAPHVRRTPTLRTEVDGRPLVLKLEHLQRSGSFKLRGAVNALRSEERRVGKGGRVEWRAER